MKNEYRIGIIGYDLFGTGGTKRSNLNLINEFLETDHRVVYFNLLPFSKNKERRMKKEVIDDSLVTFEELKDFKKSIECQAYIITRESLFSFSKIIKKMYPNAKIIGEIHTPIMLIDPELDLSESTIDIFRVATSEIKNQLKKSFGIENVKQFPVSVRHIDFSLPKIENFKEKHNLLIYSRFDEHQKDISYAIKLMENLVYDKKYKNYFLYINGTGKYEKLYKELIQRFKLEEFVFINQPIPENVIYLSTARCETLGYSILEAFSKGQRIILYEGDDQSLKDIYGSFKSICWLTKDIFRDADQINQYLQTSNDQWYKLYQNDRNELNELVFKKEYGIKYFEKIINKIIPKESPKGILIDETDILNSINRQHNINSSGLMISLYLYLKEIPGVGKIISSKKLKEFVKKILNKNQPNQILKPLLKGSLREDFIFVESFHGKSFAGDPKHLALFLKKKNPSFHFYVSSANEMVDMEILNFGMHPVRLGSENYVSKFRKSKFVIINGNSLDKAGKVENQIFIETWHGYPLKKMVADLRNKESRIRETNAFTPRMNKWDFLLVSSNENLKLFKSAFSLDENKSLKILKDGAPRNAYLINNKHDEFEKRRIIQKYFNREHNSAIKYILFCPTWRSQARKRISNLDLVKLINLLPTDYQVIVKLHPLESELIDFYSNLDKRISVFPNEVCDIQELFLITEILITDYSSAMFDFAHLGKKIIVLQEDSQKYGENIGYYFDLKTETGLDAMDYTEYEIAEIIVKNQVLDYDRKIVKKFLSDDNSLTCENIVAKIF